MDIEGRGKALESAFFGRRDQKLLQKLKAEIDGKESRDVMRSVSGIEDDAVLDKLIAAGVTAESLSAVSLIPLVAVAWCDDSLESTEKATILEAAKSSGIAEGSAAAALLSSWLESRPGNELLDSWKSYVGGLKEQLDESSFAQVRTSVIKRAEAVADAAGGFLGMGKVSDKEKKAIADLAAAFG